MSHCRDPQPEVVENYLVILKININKFWCVNSDFFPKKQWLNQINNDNCRDLM